MKAGQVIGGKCYKYYSTMLNFDAAKKSCEDGSGKLWAPNVSSANLWTELFPFTDVFGKKSHVICIQFCSLALFYLLSGATNHDVWTGFKRDSGVVKDTSGTVITGPLVSGARVPNEDCKTLNWDYGAFFLEGEPCTNLNDYVCEFPTS